MATTWRAANLTLAKGALRHRVIGWTWIAGAFAFLPGRFIGHLLGY